MNSSYLTIKEAITAIKSKQISCLELTQSCLTNIKKIGKKLNTFITVNEAEAISSAKKCDQLFSKNQHVFTEKPLLGIPAAIKDLFTTDDLTTTAGARIIDNYIPPFDATVVEKLKNSGVVIIGKTNEDAWGHGSSGENSDFGPTKNPYDLEKVPGGSSSGSGAALASGQCLLSTGTDTGSSVRLPASFCNLVGIKPTYGRVSRYGIIAMASSFDSIGHLTRTVEDSAMVLEVTAGLDPFDATTVPVEVPKYSKTLNKNIRDLKLGIPDEYFIGGLDKIIEKITWEAIKKLEKLGVEVRRISLPHTKYAMACYYILVPSEVSSNLARFDGIRYGHQRQSFGDEAKRRIMLGTYILSAGYFDAYYLKAAKVRALIKNDFENAFKEVDFLLVPTSPNPPFRLGEKTNKPLQMYLSDMFLCPVNVAGIPSLNVPCGFINSSTSSLPVGMQIVGPQFSEELLFQVGYAYEQETQWYKRRPKI